MLEAKKEKAKKEDNDKGKEKVKEINVGAKKEHSDSPSSSIITHHPLWSLVSYLLTQLSQSSSSSSSQSSSHNYHHHQIKLVR